MTRILLFTSVIFLLMVFSIYLYELNDYDYEPPFDTIHHGEQRHLEKWILDGNNPNTVDENGNSLLCIALKSPKLDPDILNVLLKNGADSNAQDSSGNPALVLAAQNCFAWADSDNSIMKTLVSYGANPECVDSKGQPLLEVLMKAPSGDIMAASRGELHRSGVLMSDINKKTHSPEKKKWANFIIEELRTVADNRKISIQNHK